jgi:4-amino-4-deoxy-L-arabinose transferase-like glycosyltransferase
MLPRRISISVLIPAVVILGVAAILFATAPKAENFWWTDAASFALNGELVHDYIASGLHQSPMAFADAWFRRYPAISFSLYPPIFPIAEAFVFALFGFSHPAAQATVAAFIVVAGYGIFRLTRTAVGPLAAAGGVLLTFAAPGILLWSRQVMMEVPALAFTLLASSWLLSFQENRRPRDLFLATFLALCAVYTKQPAIFIAPAFAIALFVQDGRQLVRDKFVWIAAAAGTVGLLPLVAFTLWTAPDLIDITLGQGIAAYAGGAIQGSAHFAQARAYALALPEIVGWPLLAGAAGFGGVALIRGWRNSVEKRLAVLMLAWFGCDFVFVAATGHVEARYGMALAVPCAVLSLLMILRLPLGSARSWGALATGAAAFLLAISTHTVNQMSGFDKVAAYLLEHSRQDDVVWFQGKESKNLIFSVRSHDPTPKLFLLRFEKFLVDYHITRDWGIADRGWTRADIEKLVDRNHISIVVLQPGFWADLPSVALMQDYIYSDRFKQVAEFPITADDPSQRTTIKVFVNQRPAITTSSTDR